MSRMAMQVYLTPEQHAALQQEAHRSQRSMTQVVRDLIDAHVVDGHPRTDWWDLAGTADFGYPTNIGQDKERMLDEAFSDLLRH